MSSPSKTAGATRRRLHRVIGALIIAVGRPYIRFAPARFGKRHLWKLCSAYANWRDFRSEVRTTHGIRLFCSSRDVIQCYVMYFGVWEPNLTRFFERRLKPGDLVIDVGANIGYFSLLASRLVGPSGQVVAIEASPRTFQALSDNIARNGVTNIRAINMAASRTRGTVHIYAGADFNSGLTSIIEREGSVVEGSVAAAPLKELATPDELRRARVIKIDVEGAEADVLASVLSSIDDLGPDTDIVVEVTPAWRSAEGESAVDLLERFQSFGYRAYELVNDYAAEAYIGGPRSLILRPLNRPITQQTDLVLSRRADLVDALSAITAAE